MPQRNRFAELLPELTEIRRDIHMNPEILFDTHLTSAKVEAFLKDIGCDDVVGGIGRTGVVGVIKGKTDNGRVVGLRADMDALPIIEATGLDYASTIDGKMHACGHDGHTTMLLGAAKYLAETRNFDGTAVVIFQPAEEGGGGGREMVEDGLMDRWNIQEVYGMHNWPGIAEGTFHIRAGSFFASTDTFDIEIVGKGGHAAKPQEAIDPTVAASHVVLAFQTIASRNADPVKQIVVSVTSFETESKAYNVIPPRVHIRGTIRTLDEDTRQMALKRVREIAEHTALAHGAVAEVTLDEGYPVMVNDPVMTDHAIAGAKRVSGDCADAPLVMGGEDFAFMSNARPGAYILVGNGDSAPVHHPEYNFNDDIIPAGSSWYVEMVEGRMPAQ